MKKIVSCLCALALVLSCGAGAFAVQPQAVSELYSAEGVYTDSLGNVYVYSYHVPQLTADTPAAAEINAEIAEKFGEAAEAQLGYMERGFSLWSDSIEWHAYWDGDWIFLLVKGIETGDINEYGVYGYDLSSGVRVTKEMILERRSISEEVYRENLREKAQFMYEDMHRHFSEEIKNLSWYDELLEQTLSDENVDSAALFINRVGDLEAVMWIYSPAGAGRYAHLVTPFAYG